MQKIKVFKLILIIIACQFFGALGSIFTIPNISTWYAELNKPFFNPPNWIFGPVWTLLFLLMGIAIFLILETKNVDKNKKKIAQVLFVVQFFFNFLWSLLFFGLNSTILGFIGIIILLPLIIATTISFYKINKKAAYLMLPYILWVFFATILNFSILILNL